MENFWRSWHYKNLTILFFSLLFVFSLSRIHVFHEFLHSLGGFGYLSAFIGGFLFVSTFTVAAGGLIMLILAERLDIFWLGLAAACGSLLGDFLIFRYVKDRVSDEIERLYKKFGGNHLTHIVHTRYFHWTLPVIGALIIISPLPDDLGVSLLGISKMKTHHFLMLSFILNAIGIIIILALSNFIKP